MNDFTKDELETLRSSNNIAIQYHGLSPEREALLEKLNLLIDNYCEHLNDNKFNALPEEGSVKMCKKCQGFYV